LDLDGADVNDTAPNTNTIPKATRGTIELPLRCIIRAREEASLVKLMLKCHREGTPFQRAFTVGDIPEETTLGEFPGWCYGTVRVCFSCFCVYDLIERARNWTITHKKRNKMPSQDSAETPGDCKLDERENSLVQTPEACANMRAQRAISRLTTLDVAELRSYASPPPAVSLVTTALFILLTGGLVLSWLEARHAMANGETFLQISESDEKCHSLLKELNRVLTLALQACTSGF